MKELTVIIGKNLKMIRTSRGLSLDGVSEMTGISKAMLGQIERGESNPTVATLWKIASGLKVSFSSFLEDQHAGQRMIQVSTADIKPIIEAEGRMKIYPLFYFDSSRGFEIFTIKLEPGCNHVSEPHNEGVEEYIIVTEGMIEVVIGEEVHHLNQGDALRFPANQKHGYINNSKQQACCQDIIYYRWLV
jgi:transcriptional regulator with XRE-family HTH domain